MEGNAASNIHIKQMYKPGAELLEMDTGSAGLVFDDEKSVESLHESNRYPIQVITMAKIRKINAQ